MTKSTINGITVLAPEEGKYLTNGETYSTRVYLGKNGRETDWIEVESTEIDIDLTAEEALDIIVGGGNNA